MQIAIIGAGITGTACAWALRQSLPSINVTIFEMGRGAGGRTATRTSRELPGLQISHGAPLFHASLPEAQELVSLLEQQGSVAKWNGTVGRVDKLGAPNSGGIASHGAAENTPTYIGLPAMSAVANGILQLAGGCKLVQSTMVTRFNRTNEGLELFDSKDTLLGHFDWVVVTSLTAAHPRWTEVFKTEVPLVGAAKDSAALQEALAQTSSIQSTAVQTVMAAWEGEDALSSLPFDITYWDNPIFSKVVRSHAGGYTNLVIYSTEEFAAQHSKSFGSTGTAARMGADTSGGEPESVVVHKLFSAFTEASSNFFKEIPVPKFGPHLHRWGSAFPKSGLKQAIAVDGVCLTGDYVGDVLGSVESAMQGGVLGAKALIDTCSSNL